MEGTLELTIKGFHAKIDKTKYKIYDKSCLYFVNLYNEYGVRFYDSSFCAADDENDNVIENLAIKSVEKDIFTDDEIISPCCTFSEYSRKMKYLKEIYFQLRQRENSKELNTYDFVSDKYTSSNNSEFVKHHIWLYIQLKKNYRPTIFPYSPQEVGTSPESKVLAFLSCLPFTDEDDGMINDVRKYLFTYGGRVAKKLYEHNQLDAVMDLINRGYVKTPTMNTLLEMANDKEDTKFAAYILDKLKDKHPKNRSAKFAL